MTRIAPIIALALLTRGLAATTHLLSPVGETKRISCEKFFPFWVSS